MPRHVELPRVLAEAEVLAKRLDIPVRIVNLHRESTKGTNQYALRWGAFLLAYAPIEGFFNGLLGYREDMKRTLPLNPDKVRQVAKAKHDVDLFDGQWGIRTRTTRGNKGNRSDWACYVGPAGLRCYMADMKCLRDLLTHGADPFTTTNASGALWPTNKGPSMRLMGVEGFVQACCDLAGQTILAYGGQPEEIPSWPEPQRSAVSAEERPRLPLLV